MLLILAPPAIERVSSTSPSSSISGIPRVTLGGVNPLIVRAISSTPQVSSST